MGGAGSTSSNNAAPAHWTLRPRSGDLPPPRRRRTLPSRRLWARSEGDLTDADTMAKTDHSFPPPSRKNVLPKVRHASLPSRPLGGGSTVVNLSSAKLQAVPKSLNSSVVEELILRKNALRYFDGLSSMPHLAVLDLSKCSLCDVPHEISQLSSLRALSLADNPLSEGTQFFRMLSQCGALQSLKLSKVSWSSLPPGINEMPCLTELDLSFNPLLRDGLHHLRDSAITSLNLKGVHCDEVPPEIRTLKRLKVLDLSCNNINVVSGLPESSLESLDIHGNPLANPVCAYAKTWEYLGRLRKLRRLIFQKWASSEKNVNPYTTRVPLPLLGLPLESLNGVTLKNRHTKCLGDNMKTVICGGYFKIDLGLDMEQQFVQHMSMLHRFSTQLPGLEKRIHLSVMRYRMYLLLASKHSGALLHPPIDVLFVHYIHMTHPVEYKKDCESLFGVVIPNKYISELSDDASGVAHTRALWSAVYGEDGPYAYNPSPHAVASNADSSSSQSGGRCQVAPLPEAILDYAFSVDFVRAAEEAKVHILGTTDNAEFLVKHARATAERFRMFLALQAIVRMHPCDLGSACDSFGCPDGFNGEVKLVPTPALQLMLHAYQCVPTRMMHQLTGGSVVDPNIHSGEHYTKGMLHTTQLWREVWGEAYISEGAGAGGGISPTGRGMIRQLRESVASSVSEPPSDTESLAANSSSGVSSGTSFPLRRRLSSLKDQAGRSRLTSLSSIESCSHAGVRFESPAV